jgi:hypothetical protein
MSVLREETDRNVCLTARLSILIYHDPSAYCRLGNGTQHFRLKEL